MKSRRLQNQWIAWIALLAILLAAFVQTVSHLPATGSNGFFWAEICSVNGMQSVKMAIDPAPVSSPGQTDNGLQHCSYCPTHAGSSAFMPTAAFEQPVVSGFSLLPAAFYQSSHPLFAWSTPQSRAPPAHS